MGLCSHPLPTSTLLKPFGCPFGCNCTWLSDYLGKKNHSRIRPWITRRSLWYLKKTSNCCLSSPLTNTAPPVIRSSSPKPPSLKWSELDLLWCFQAYNKKPKKYMKNAFRSTLLWLILKRFFNPRIWPIEYKFLHLHAHPKFIHLRVISCSL